MSDLVFSLLFACIGMTFVFLVITALTLAMLAMGFLRRKSPVPVKSHKEETTGLTSSSGPPAAHVAAIAAAITIFRGGAPTQIRMLDGDDRNPWRAHHIVSQPPGRLQVLRRTR